MKIQIEDIEIPFKEFDHEQLEIIKNLADSMNEIGLSHPILLRKCSDGERFSVVAGEKRLRAAMLLKWLIIEAEIRDVDELDGKIIRIHENLRRYNLPWHEQVALVQELHALRQTDHGISERGRPKEEKTGWSMRDTARELKVSLGSVAEDILLARALDNDPNLAKVRDKRTAIRLARIAVNRERNELEAGAPAQALRKSIGLEVDQVYYGDSADILKQLPENSIDHCITDPPWIKFFDEALRIDDRTLPVFKELYRVLKFNSFVYIFAGLDDYAYYSGYNLPGSGETDHKPGKLEEIGFKVSLTPIIWQKENSLSRRGVRPWEYDRDYELIIVAAKGNPILTASGKYSGVKTYPVVPSPSLVHPNEKPLAIIEDLIDDCSYEDQIIIDPFGGSGSTALACKGKNRRYITIERDREFYEVIVNRLSVQGGA